MFLSHQSALLAQQYPGQVELLPTVREQAKVPEVAELQRQLAERDQTITCGDVHLDLGAWFHQY